ncbi:MAG: hypothetical protein M3Y87_05685, partial [Myxococcota bacterium]|nr:hypothetical protein [Myxococcota bacterium]
LTIGSILSSLGYGGSIATGAEVHRTRAGAADCREGYAADHFAPFAGAFAGLGRGVGCANLGLAWLALDILTTALQLSGALVLALGGLIGEETVALDGPLDLELAPWAGPDGAGIVLGLPLE